jgi:hypothetical protein
MYDYSGQQIVILTTIWWWQNIGRDWQIVNNDSTDLIWSVQSHEIKQQFRVQISNRFAALEDLDAEEEINSAWETINEKTKISAQESLGYFELKEHKPWIDEGCSKFLDQRNQAKLQWFEYTSEINGDSLYNVRREASRYFKNK